MSGANLDGYNTPREGIHKTEMLKRIDKLEEEMIYLKKREYDLSGWIQYFRHQFPSDLLEDLNHDESKIQ
jgi:hypothetical protein